ncbi:endonuclease [Sulfitobacter porphyrae]|nr:endonuclease [Sulfitobacter porphyrae]
MGWVNIAIDGVIWVTAALLLIATLLPLSKLPHGIVRGGEFPREQIFVLAVVLATVMATTQRYHLGSLAAAVLMLVAIVQLAFILKFTPIWPRQSVAADPVLRQDTDCQISLLTANVKKSNRDYGRLIDMTLKRAPDVMMAIEVDADWVAALRQGLGPQYPHWIEAPRDNGYGMCLMSKLKLSRSEVRDLIVDEVPSIRTIVTLRNGMCCRVYVVHPEPPVIDHDTKGRDSEIALVGLEAEQDELPAIVTGDLNDVAWSTTTRRFQRLSGLLDPRVGRGFYNTFSATMPWMRWPLDHLFHDPQFRLVDMARLGKIGSDHFPMWFVLALTGQDACDSDPGDCEEDEVEEAEDMIEAEKRRDREAIGSDWEDE